MPINFTVTDNHFGSNPDGVDGGLDADVVALIGPVKFTAQFADTRPALAPSASPRPAQFTFREFTGYVDTDGQLKSERGGSVGVRLWANDPIFNLQQLWYRVDYTLTTPLGDPTRLAFGYFQAPTTDTTVSLPSVLQQTGSTSPGITTGPPGGTPDDVRRVGDTVIFSIDGVDLPDPVDISDFIIDDNASVDGGTPSDPGEEILDGGTP